MAVKFGINYELFNIDKQKTIIFLHGWGSNQEVMKSLKDLFDEYKLLFLDMPGFGKSKTDEVWDTHKYAKKLEHFFGALNIEKYCIIGHSFGGKVATLLNPKYLILLSSAGIVEEKPFSVRFKIKLFKLLKPFGIAKLRKLFVSADAKEMSENMYETFKKVVNEDFSSYFQAYKGKAIVFGGNADTAVSPRSNAIISQLLQSNLIMLSGDHYFFFSLPNKEKIAKEVKDLIG